LNFFSFIAHYKNSSDTGSGSNSTSAGNSSNCSNKNTKICKVHRLN